jgi:hypothetical protein
MSLVLAWRTVLLLLFMAQAAGREGTVTGSLTLNGHRTALRHVYASAQSGFFDKSTEDIRVLLSDVPLSDQDRSDPFALVHLGRDGKARILEVVLDHDGAPISGAIYAREFDGMVSAAGMHEFTRERFDRSVVAGHLTMATPHTFDHVTFQYDATFSAPIPRPPTAAQVADALASPPGHAASAYLAAVRSGRLPEFLVTLAPAARGAYAGADGAAKLAQLAADMPPDSQVTSLEPQTDGTVLATIDGHDAGVVISYTVRVVRDGDGWRVIP